MFEALPERLRELIFRASIYEWMLPSRPPSSVRVPQGNVGVGAQAAWAADMLFRPPAFAGSAMRDDFRALSVADPNPADAWPLIRGWLAGHRHWHPDTWRADILAERLTRWLGVFDAISVGIDPAERANWATHIYRSAKHLNRVRIGDIAPWRRFLVHQARINAAIALPEIESTLQHRLNELGRDVDLQVLGDGGHIERTPVRALAVLAILIEIRDALIGHHVAPPQGLISAIDRMVPFIKALQHADGGFALVGGATADTGPLIDAVIQASGGKGRAMASAPHTGFHRLRAGQTTLICDCGRTLSTENRFRAPASFELSIGKVRLIGNCGMRLSNDSAREEWTKALASTPAHTALGFGERDAGQVFDVDVKRRDHEGARLIEMSHDGFQAQAGIHHTRTLYLDAGGTDMRGEDALSGGGSQPFSVRFHLHPDVSASMVAGGGVIILKPPRGRGWRFTCHYPVRLEDSVSFYDGRLHRAQQIVILGNHEPAETIVKWRIAVDA